MKLGIDIKSFAIGVVATLVVVSAVYWGNRKAQIQRHDMAVQQRRNYANAVRTHFQGHELWKSNEIIKENLKSFGGGKDFIFRNESSEIRKEVLSTLIAINRDMNVLCEPQTLLATEDTCILASPDGWLKLSGNWITDNRATDDVKVLRVEYKMSFEPRSGPTDKQNLKRLSWVTWSPPLSNNHS
jgi:hypothetical protein